MIIVAPVIVPPVIPDPPPPPASLTSPSMRWTLTAPWLDRTWTLTDLSSPVMKTAGATGTGQVDPEHWWSTSPALDGSSWEGGRVDRGSVFIPLIVQGSDADRFLAEHSAFAATLDPRREVTFRITKPDGKWREIPMRYDTGGDLTADLDVLRSCYATYGITWSTADPYWRGEPMGPRFEYELPTAFFPGPPFVLASGQSLNSATVTNPGDVEAHPIWRVEGPFTGFSVGVGSSLVDMTVSKGLGEWVEIDMRPGVLEISHNGDSDLFEDGAVNVVRFSSIPPGDTDLTTIVYGSGIGSAVELSYTPRYRRGW